MKSSIVKNVLFITSTRLGDAVISTGILNHLLENYPNAEFTIACGSIAAGIFERMPRRKKTLIMEKLPYDMHWFKLWRRCVVKRWDLVVDLRGSALSYTLWAKKRIAIRGGRIKEKRVEYLANALNIHPTPMPVVWVNEQDTMTAKKLLPNDFYVALAPTANWSGKVWDIHRFIALAEKIQTIYPQCKFAVFYGSGKQEHEMAEALLESGLPIIDVGGNFTLVQVAAMLKSCKAFIGNDSGLMHLAAACQTPTLGLFGPSQVAEYAPTGKNAYAVVAEGIEGKAPMDQLSVDKVFAAFENLIQPNIKS